jgi:hypothetical protein
MSDLFYYVVEMDGEYMNNDTRRGNVKFAKCCAVHNSPAMFWPLRNRGREKLMQIRGALEVGALKMRVA